MKYRILIRAFTARRDVMYFQIIAKLLEKKNCDVIISSLRSFDFFIKFWKPHAIIFNTQGDSLSLKKKSPSSKIIFIPGEGAELYENSIASLWNKLGMDHYNSVDLTFLWSKYSLDECKKKIKIFDEKKFCVSGNPKLDIVQFNRPIKKKNKIKTIGISCRYSTINHHEGVPVVRTLLPNREIATNFTFASMFSFHTMMLIIEKLLKTTDLEINIRPHPNEAADTYLNYVIPYFKNYKKRIKINSSICIVDWFKEIDVMLSPTTTSIYEATLLNIPIVSIEKLSPSVIYSAKESEQSKEFIDSLTSPKSVESLVNLLIKNFKIKTSSNTVIMNQLKKLHLWPRKQSACLIIANEISNLLKRNKMKSSFFIPKRILLFIDKIKFKRAMKINPLHWNFNYSETYYKLPKDFDYIINSILKNKKRI